MKIGIDARALTERRAGIGTYVYEIIKELNKIDSNNEYYLYSNKKIHIDFKLNKNFKICEYNYKIGTYFIYYKLGKILKNDNIDIFFGTEHCLPKRDKFTKNVKYILTIHDLAIQKLGNVGSTYNTIIQKLVVKRSCLCADSIIAISNSTKNDLIDIYEIEKDKINVIYDGVSNFNKYNLNKKQEEEIETKYSIKNNNFIFFISTIEPRKNLDTIIKAFELYKEKNNDDLKLIISGKEGWKCKKTLELIENSKYKEYIIRTGFISDLERDYFYKNCKAFIYPSLYEGFGLPVLEAFAREAVVITSNISSLPEVGGEAAIYLNDVYDTHELSLLIEKVVAFDDSQRNKHIEEGLKQVKKFSWEKCVKETFQLLEGD